MKKLIKVGSCIALCMAVLSLSAFMANTVLTGLAIQNSTIDSTTIGATTPSTLAGTFPASSTVKIFQTTGTSCTTGGVAGNQCTTSAITFPGPAWVDTGYIGGCWTEGPSTGSPVIQGISGGADKTTTTFKISVMEVGSVASAYNTANCIFFHP